MAELQHSNDAGDGVHVAIFGAVFVLLVAFCLALLYMCHPRRRRRCLHGILCLPEELLDRFTTLEGTRTRGAVSPIYGQSAGALAVKRKDTLTHLKKYSLRLSRQHFVSADGSHYVGENDDDTVSDTTEDSGSIEATHDAIRLFISDEKKTTIDNNEGCEKISPTNSNAVNESALVAVKCAICLEQYEVGDELTYSCNTSCSHCYHQHCIADWIVQQWGKGKQGRRVASSANGEHINSKWQIVECPVCRQLFTKIEKGNLLIRSGENGIATHVPAVWQNRENVDIGNTANSSIETTATESTAEIDAEIGVGR